MSEIDYQYYASGYKHDIFRRGNYAYKTVKDAFEEENCRNHFETECFAMDIMRVKGFCVPRECEILSPSESFNHKWTLKESWIEGKQFRDGEMPIELEEKVFNMLIELAQSISGDYYGPISPRASKAYSWRAFLKTLHENHPLARVACPALSISSNRINELIDSLAPENPNPVFITMDTNLMNFFFDMNGNIVGIIDVEDPIFGDFLFLLADIRWCRDHWFHRDDWFLNWVQGFYETDEELVDLYEFLIAFREIEIRYKTDTSHYTIDQEFLLLEKKLLHL
jgi:hypothetical protein